MHVSILAINETLFSGEAAKLTARTSGGEITILDGHLPIISDLTGPVGLTDNSGKRTDIDASSGFIEVRPESEVVILVNK